jgi:microcystin-dependent protein
MADNFLGELRVVPFNFAPTGWALCEGQLLPISQNTALFSLLGTNYGGDGKSTFGLPDYRGRIAVGHGQGFGLSEYLIGDEGGMEKVALQASELPPHTHSVKAVATTGTEVDPKNGVYAAGNVNPRFGKMYGATHDAASSSAVGTPRGNEAHENRAPSLSLNVIIAVTGIFPSRP